MPSTSKQYPTTIAEAVDASARAEQGQGAENVQVEGGCSAWVSRCTTPYMRLL